MVKDSVMYFVSSDIHSFFKPFKKALDKAGFDMKNKNHVLIINGDLFDRGPDSVKLYDFIRSIPQERRILIRGNHEDMLCDICDKGYFEDYNLQNCTDQTIFQFVQNMQVPPSSSYSNIMSQMIASFKTLGIQDWIRSKEWRNYYELGPYIITHSFIPLKDIGIESVYLEKYNHLSYIPDWRKLDPNCTEWTDAKWGCPFVLYYHFFQEERKNKKILVCGHWHVQDFHLKFEGKKNDSLIYCKDGLIGLDACTAVSQRCNILVIDSDSFNCFDGNGLLPLNPNKVCRENKSQQT